MKLETNVKLLNAVVVGILVVVALVGYKIYEKYQQIDSILDRVKTIEKLTPAAPKFPKIFGEPEIVYVLPEQADTPPRIDPDRVPINGPMWDLKPVDTIETLVPHLEEHEVVSSQVVGWTHPQLKKLHSYLHNGGKLEALY